MLCKWGKLTVKSNGTTLKQTEAVISLESGYLYRNGKTDKKYNNLQWLRQTLPFDPLPFCGTDLAEGEVVKEGRSTVCLPEGEGRGVAGNFEASTTVLGCNLSLEGPPVIWVRVQSLKRENIYQLLCNTNIQKAFTINEVKSGTQINFLQERGYLILGYNDSLCLKKKRKQTADSNGQK